MFTKATAHLRPFIRLPSSHSPASPDHFTSNPSLLHHLPQHGSSNALAIHGQHSAQTGSASGHAGRAGYGGGANAGGGYTGHARAFLSLPQTASADSSSTNLDEKKENASPNTSLLLRQRLSKAPRIVYMNESVRARREIEARKGGKEFTVVDIDQKQRRRSIANYASGRVPLSRSSTPQLLSRSSTPLELLQVGVPQHRSISLRALSTSTRAMEAEDVEAIEERERMTPRVQTPKSRTMGQSKRVLMDLAGKEDIFGQKLGGLRRNSTAALERPSLDQPPFDLSSPTSPESESDKLLEQAILNALNQARSNYDAKATERLVQHYRSPRKLAPLSPDAAPGLPELASAYPLPSSFTLRGYNTCLYALLQLRTPGKSIAPILELYNELLERDLIPDNTTYGTVIRALSMREQEILENKASWDMTKRWGLWLQETCGYPWDTAEAVSRDADVERYMSEGNLNSALKLFRAAALTGQANFEASTYGSLLAAMSLKDSPDLEGMKQIVQFGRENKVQGLVSVYKQLIVAAAKAGKEAELGKVWEEFETLAGQASAEEWGSSRSAARIEGVKRESYEKGFVAFLQVGDLSKAFEIFSRMAESAETSESTSAIPAANVNTCGELVVGLAKSGQIDLALEWLDKVSSTSLVQQEQFHRLNVSHLAAFTDVLIFDGRVLEAVSVMSHIKNLSPDVEHFTRSAVQYRIWRGHTALTSAAAKAASPEERDAFLKGSRDLLAVFPSRIQPDSLIKHIDILAQAGQFTAIPEILSLVEKAGNLSPRYLRSYASALDRVASLEMPFGDRIKIIDAFSSFQQKLTPVVAESVVQSYAVQRKTGSAQEFGLTQQAAFTLVESLAAYPTEKVQQGDLDTVLEQLMTDIQEIDAGENSDLRRAQQHFAVGRLAEILAFRFGVERAESMLSPVFGDAAKEMVQPAVEEPASESELSSGEVSETATSATSAMPSLTVSEALTRNIDRFAQRNPSITPLDAYAILRTGLQKQEVPRLETLLNLVDHLARASDEPKVRELYDLAQIVLHSLVRPEAQAQSWYAIENAMLIACCHLGHLEEAGLHRAQIVQAGFAPSSDAYATMIASSKDTTDDALVARELWEEALSMGVKPHLFLYNTIISKLSRARKAESALELFGRMKDSGIKPSSVTYGAVINACCRVGDAQSAETLFEEMVSKPNFRPRVPPYNTMMQFYLQTQPNRERVLHYYSALQQARVPPSAHTYKLLLDAYATLSPTDIPSMELVFSRLSGDRNVRVQGTHWASLISGYGLHANDLSKAKEVFESIPSTQKGNVQESVVWEAWLNVLSQKATIVELEEAHNKMVESGVQPTAYVYNVLINGYSRAGTIERAREVFESMGDSVSGVAAPNNHPTLLTSSGHAKPSTKAIISSGVVYREPSTYEAMIRAEVSCGDKARGEDVLRRMEERGYPVAVFMRGKAALDGEAPRFV
ncbi:hypothetical protein L198_07118 [Cryptococcus wingfieldii CBS 7118]|uniref:Pentatricopeptide repeat protein n=1 Tax=Cryptococcus wingfieldii CBS 7118 TaxID=1295528 RepID=A0A1E3IGQ4_9TREE|nr:hypothetical protein L198_07118 [Cryptococcus wingfieldii CBS 7118]ODN87116.1 hypothetical protein L198_07118 [Cryptococcus wingfieldii CBS 7118]